jgi:hypothetical protein
VFQTIQLACAANRYDTGGGGAGDSCDFNVSSHPRNILDDARLYLNMRKWHLRFRLRHLLVAVTAIVILLCLARWKRQHRLKEYRALHAEGVVVIWDRS